MFQTFINAWKIADLRKKMLFTALILLVFRIGAAIPVPFVDIGAAGIIAAVSYTHLGVDEELAREAMRLAANKLPIKCKFVTKEETGGEQ